MARLSDDRAPTLIAIFTLPEIARRRYGAFCVGGQAARARCQYPHQSTDVGAPIANVATALTCRPLSILR